MFWVVMMIIAYLSGLEYVKMSFANGISQGGQSGLAALFLLPVAFAGLDGQFSAGGGLLLSFLVTVVACLFGYNKLKDPYRFLLQMVLGLVYIGFLSAHLVLLHRLENGNLWLIILSAITAGSDTGAYYCGRFFGKHKLCPGISPKKTVEGAVGGLLGGVIFALFFSWLFLPATNYFSLVIVALLLVIIGISGDLTESVLKRANGVKDSGTLLAGHGGVLDRADSILFAGPALYYFLLMI